MRSCWKRAALLALRFPTFGPAMTQPPSKLPPGQMFTIDEVAALFRVSRRTFQAHIRSYPFSRVLGRRKLFPEADTPRLYEALSSPSNSPADTAVQTGTC